MNDFTSTPAVDQIAGLSDPILRNLKITQSYHELSLAFSNRTGPCANWCTFATWASKQAGQTIRHEDLSNKLRHTLKNAPELSQPMLELLETAALSGTNLGKGRIAQLIWDSLNPEAAMERAGNAVARGNQKVYAEIAREFARFAAAFLDDKTFDDEKLAEFCASFAPGDPPNGQRLLKQAFTRYYQAFFEKRPKERAELILLANLEIGLHEQTRLQPEIAEALEAAVPDPKIFKSKLLDALFPTRSWVKYIGAIFTAISQRPTPLDRAIAKFSTAARHHIRLFLTKNMMELGFPNGMELRLGRDLSAKYPELLVKLANPELLALLHEIDPTSDDLRETGAVDWADFPERIHFIADLFRCFHEVEDLRLPPFEPAQVSDLKQGIRPLGKL